MAAIFYKYRDTGNTIFRASIPVAPNVYISFLDDMVGESGFMIINEVVWQHRDTVQYFLTFDDLISFFYFGKGLGTVNVSGTLFCDCNGNWFNLNQLLARIGGVRGRIVPGLSFANVMFDGVLSSFTVRASADPNNIHAVDFSLQFDIINSSLPQAVIKGAC